HVSALFPTRRSSDLKYGFKSIKSIVRIRFVEKQPLNTWQEANADYYGFYANVNPEAPTPSYSQATERRGFRIHVRVEAVVVRVRSEGHTSELQSRVD